MRPVDKATFPLTGNLIAILLLGLVFSQTRGQSLQAAAQEATKRSKDRPKGDVAVDSLMSREDALKGSHCPPRLRAALTLINVEYWGFDKRRHRGQLLVHQAVAQETKDIFRELLGARFPIEKVIPIVRYGWDDEASMADDNTSAFNYRYVPGTRQLSRHAYGQALDINPFLNPYIQHGISHPRGAKYDVTVPGTIRDNYVVAAFEKRGWRWGGRFREKDWQHFDKQK